MAQIGFGYGSEYQLLRYLGHHRQELEEIISIVEENQIPAVFTEVNGETGAAEVVAGEAGCAVRTLDMAISNRDYFAAMRQNIDIVKEALG